MSISLAQHTEAKHGGVNEDALIVEAHPRQPGLTLVFLADGQGGRAGGGLAAKVAVESGIAIARNLDAEKLLIAATWNEIIKRIDKTVSETDGAGFTTVVALGVRPRVVVGASSGDSEALLLNVDGTSLDLTAQQTKNPPVGSGNADPRSFSRTLRAPWKLLVMSDGVTKYVYPDKLAQIVREHPKSDAIPLLLTEVKQGRGLVDDFSIAVLENAEADGDSGEQTVAKRGWWERIFKRSVQ